jgi:hypothetical protein
VARPVGYRSASHTPLDAIAFYQANWSWIPEVFLFANGLVLYVKSAIGFTAKQLGGLPELHARIRDQLLVTDGSPPTCVIPMNQV